MNGAGNQVVGARIRRRRLDQGITLRGLAERIGMTAGYLSRVENQRVTPSLDALQAIATALGVPMFWFLDSLRDEPVVRGVRGAACHSPIPTWSTSC